jgi:MATE family multidrug resistance protein
MASALDTLCSQSFTGSEDQTSLGKHLQRGLVVSFLVCVPISCLWFFAEPVFLLFGQQKEISNLAGTFARWMIPGLYPLFVNECLRRYLQAQGIMKPSMYITFFAAILSVFLQWLLVWSDINVGFVGAPLSCSIVNIFIPVATIGYIYFFEGKDQWGGWEWKEAFDGPKIWEMIKLGVPGVIMIASEWLAFEAVALAAGILGDDVLAAQTIVLNTCTLLYMVPMGLSVATTTRIGNVLGANLPKLAKKVAYTALIFSVLTATLNSSFILIARRHWGYLFTSDERVVELVANILPLAALYQISDNTGAMGGAAIRGCGLQRWGAYINLSCYYLVGIPLGLLLTFHYDLGLFGLWVGISLGLFLVSTIQLIILFRLNWEKEAIKAIKRVNSNDNNYGTFH